MSETAPDSAEIIAELYVDLVEQTMIYAMCALATYEYLVTFNQERTMIWRRKWSMVTWIFMANRYLLMSSTIWDVAPSTAESCFPEMIIAIILQITQFAVFAAFSAFRVFAILDRNIPMGLLVLALSLVPVATNTYSSTQETFIYATSPGLGTYCGYNLKMSPSLNFHLILVTRLAVIVADVLVLVMTWRKTFRHRVQAVEVGMQTPLSSLLLRDGTLYFGALLLMSVALIMVDLLPSLENISPIENILATLEPILISRFLLNLRQVGVEVDSVNNTQDASTSRFSVPGFRIPTLESILMVGNMKVLRSFHRNGWANRASFWDPP